MASSIHMRILTLVQAVLDSGAALRGKVFLFLRAAIQFGSGKGQEPAAIKWKILKEMERSLK